MTTSETWDSAAGMWVTAPGLDLDAIRKRAEYVPVWDESVQCADPCYICGGRAVTYINPTINATATFGPTKFFAVCKEHAGQPWNLHGGCRSDALALLSEVERLEQRLAEATEQLIETQDRFDKSLAAGIRSEAEIRSLREQLQRQGEVVEAARVAMDCLGSTRGLADIPVHNDGGGCLAQLSRVLARLDAAVPAARYYTADPPAGAKGSRSGLCWGNGHPVCVNPECECDCGHPAQPKETAASSEDS